MKRVRAFYNAFKYLIGNRNKYYEQFKKDYKRDIEIQDYAQELKKKKYDREPAIRKIGDIVIEDGIANFVRVEDN